jgi:malonyl-CoA/methylmalonyl-CoA synthetase
VKGSVGLPLPGVNVRLVDDHGHTINDLDVAGELQVRSNGLFKE